MSNSNKKQRRDFGVWYTLVTCVSLLYRFRPSFLWMQFTRAIYNALFGYFTMHIIAVCIDSIIEHRVNSIFDGQFLFLLVSFLSMMIFERVIYQFIAVENQKFDRDFPLFLRNRIAEKRISLELAQLDDPRVSNISIKANESLDRISKYTQHIITVIENAYIVILGIIIVLPHSLFLVLLSTVVTIPEYFISKYITKERYTIYDATTYIRRQINDYRLFLLRTKEIKEVKLGSSGDALIQKATEKQIEINDAHLALDRNRRRVRSIVGVFIASAYVVGIFYLLNQVLLGIITVGIFTLLSGQLNNIRKGLLDFWFYFNTLESDSMYLQDVFRFLNLQHRMSDGTKQLPSVIQDIQFDQVTFGYENSGAVVLDNVSIVVPAGSRVAIVGENGAGKTTFIKLLLRFYDPNKGSILINGTALSEFSRAQWYSRISYMSQDYNRYPFVLREAITIGESPDQFDQDRYDRALRISQVDRLLAELPLGDQTVLSPQYDNGVELSVGQTQKVAIARTLYRRADICILDEPTSAIDAISELQIFNAIEQLPDPVTIFLISHRFNTVKNADIIIVLEHGRIIESGGHNELMALGGRYYEMYTAQKDSYE